jgi:pyrroline-5-carboxylate reductase
MARTYGLAERQTHELLLKSALGSILVARDKAASLPALLASVANPGGLTEAGVSVLGRDLPPLVAAMKQAMDDKIRQRRLRYFET